MIVIPFQAPNSVRGLMRLEDDDTLVLEFKHQTWGGLAWSRLKEARIRPEQIASARLEEGWSSASLVLQSNTLHVWETFPNALEGRVHLRVHKDHRAKAAAVAARLCPAKGAPVDDLA